MGANLINSAVYELRNKKISLAIFIFFNLVKFRFDVNLKPLTP